MFGARGDLTKRLLIPSLYTLAGQRLLDPDFVLLGVDRADGDDESWRAELRDTMQSFTSDPSGEFYAPSIDEAVWSWLATRTRYASMDFNDSAAIDHLKATLSGNVVFYCAVAPRFSASSPGSSGAPGCCARR